MEKNQPIFAIDPNPTFTLPVMLPVPGKPAVEVQFRFRHLDGDAFYSMLNESRAKGDTPAEFLARFVDGWEGENINAPFSLEALEKLTKNYPKSSKAVFMAYEAELIGALGKN